MNVLVINCGSSSLKFQLINAETEKVSHARRKKPDEQLGTYGQQL